MVMDANGNSHKAGGRPDGGQFDRKAGQGSDGDLPAGGYVPGEDADADRTAVKERPETLSDADWRILRHSDSWGVRMLAWSNPLAPKPTDREFEELLFDDNQRVRGAAAYRTDLTEKQVDALLHDANPNVRRKALMADSASRDEIDRLAHVDNNEFVRGTANLRRNPTEGVKSERYERDTVQGGVHVSDGRTRIAGVLLSSGRRWRTNSPEGYRIDLSNGAAADVALVEPSSDLSDYGFRKQYGMSRPGALDPVGRALLAHTVKSGKGYRDEVVVVMPPDAGLDAGALDDVAYAFHTESKDWLASYKGQSRAVMSVTADGVNVTVLTRDGVDEEASEALWRRMTSDRRYALDALPV